MNKRQRVHDNIPTAQHGNVVIVEETENKRPTHKYSYTIIKNSGTINKFITGKQMTEHAVYRRATLKGFSMSGVETGETVYFVKFINLPTNNFSNDPVTVPQNSIPILLPTGLAVVSDNDVNILIFDQVKERKFPNQWEISVLKEDGTAAPITKLILRIEFEA